MDKEKSLEAGQGKEEKETKARPREWSKNSRALPRKGGQAESARRPPALWAWPGPWEKSRRLGEPSAGPDPRPLRPFSAAAAKTFHPEGPGENHPPALVAP